MRNDEIQREVVVTVTTSDRVDIYNSRERARAARTFPAGINPGVIAGWAGRTAIEQQREAERSFPLPKPPEPEKSPEERLDAVASAPTDAAAEAVADDLPW